ncbi:MAG: hypothetical protein LLG40_09735 [Deltaproteobacteria bacterium]|nr:hypothetical protein [Deltaproteobacteria bacterium]
MKLLRYMWALPNTLLGLLFVPLALLSRGGVQVVGGVLEIHGGLIDFFLNHCLPVRGKVDALTLGHTILGRNRESLETCRRHESAHVRQYEILGPTFIFVYLAAALWALIKSRGAYKGNYLERKAIEQEHLRK